MREERTRTPLEEIERNVQARAKNASLDMEEAGAIDRIAALVHEEITAWQLDHRRGVRPFDLVDAGQLAERAVRNLTGYGPLGPLLGIEMGVFEVL